MINISKLINKINEKQLIRIALSFVILVTIFYYVKEIPLNYKDSLEYCPSFDFLPKPPGSEYECTLPDIWVDTFINLLIVSIAFFIPVILFIGLSVFIWIEIFINYICVIKKNVAWKILTVITFLSLVPLLNFTYSFLVYDNPIQFLNLPTEMIKLNTLYYLQWSFFSPAYYIGLSYILLYPFLEGRNETRNKER